LDKKTNCPNLKNFTEPTRLKNGVSYYLLQRSNFRKLQFIFCRGKKKAEENPAAFFYY